MLAHHGPGSMQPGRRPGLLAGPACASTQVGTSEVLARASQAMEAGQLRTLRYVGDGMGYSFGQAFSPGGAWPKITLHSVIRTIDYDSGSG